jgi:hypothetical protein
MVFDQMYDIPVERRFEPSGVPPSERARLQLAAQDGFLATLAMTIDNEFANP